MGALARRIPQIAIGAILVEQIIENSVLGRLFGLNGDMVSYGNWIMTHECFGGGGGPIRWHSVSPTSTSCAFGGMPNAPGYTSFEAYWAANASTQERAFRTIVTYNGGLNWRYSERWVKPNNVEGLPGPVEAPMASPIDVPWPQEFPLPDIDTWPVGVPYPVVAPAVRGVPPGSVHSSRTSAQPRISTTFDNRPVPRPRRPRKGEKERKIRDRKGLLAIIGGALSTWSEFNDFVESLHDALPKELKTKDGTIFDKYNDLYRHLDQVDMDKAVKNLIYNQFEDEVIGRMFGAADKLGGKGTGSNIMRAVSGAR